MTFDELAPRLSAVGRDVARDFTARFEAAKAAGSSEIFSKALGFANSKGELGPDNTRWPQSPIKFAIDVERHLSVVRTYLPHLRGLGATYEIGVGAGYLMRALIDVNGLPVRGCDVEIAERGVYKAIRGALGLTDLVEEQAIRYGQAFALPAGTRSVIAFLPVFDFGWREDQYNWFHANCAAQGAKTVFWRRNRPLRDDPLASYFERIGVMPVQGDAQRFVVVTL